MNKILSMRKNMFYAITIKNLKRCVGLNEALWDYLIKSENCDKSLSLK